MAQHTTHMASNNTPPGGNTPNGNLPFTGADLGIPVLVAALCVAVGFMARKFGHAGR